MKYGRKKINNVDVGLENVLLTVTEKFTLKLKIIDHQYNLEKEKITSEDEKVKLELTQLSKELDQFLIQLDENYHNFEDFTGNINSIYDDELRGLTTQKIQQFEQFTADESFVDDQCVICMEDIEIGRNMMRLDCDGQHTFCQVCIERWFDEHKTCPTCRHEF